MKRDPRTEVVSVRLTKAEKERLDAMGGPSVLRRVLYPEALPMDAVVVRGPHSTDILPAPRAVVWFDGTVGLTWPALAS